MHDVPCLPLPNGHVARRLQKHHTLHHPHIIKLWDVFVTEGHLNIVLEKAGGGTLLDYVSQRHKDNGGTMHEDEAR
jgi:serine/threonine protein kinase